MKAIQSLLLIAITAAVGALADREGYCLEEDLNQLSECRCACYDTYGYPYESNVQRANCLNHCEHHFNS